MSKKISKFQYIIYCLLIILPIYQDSPLVDIIGSAGASLMPVVSVVVGTVVIILRRRIATNKYIRTWLKLGGMLFVISYVALFAWWILGKPMTVYQEWLPTKALKIILQYFSYVIYVMVVLMFVRKTDTQRIFAPIYFTLLLLTGICLIELTQVPEALKLFHYSGVFPYWRVRLLTKESSWTAVMIVNYSMLSLFYGLEFKKRFITVTSVICASVLLASSASKTLLGIFAIGLGIFIVYESKRLRLKSTLILIATIAALITFIFSGGVKFREMLLSDIENFTSMATRSFTIIVGAIIGIIFPFGIGASIYVSVFPEYMERWISWLPEWLNRSEIIHYIYSDDDIGLAVKSGLFQYHVFWGVVGTTVFLISIYRINKHLRNSSIKNKNLLTTVLLCNLVMLAFTTSFTYEFWMLLAILMGLNDLRANQTGILEKQ